MPVIAIRHLSVILAALLATSATAADKKKADPKKAAPTAATAKDDKKGKKPPERRGPASFKDAPMFEDVEKEAIADKKRDEQIESAKKIIPKIEDGNPQKADMYFQLSEFYWEKSRYLYRKEMLKFFGRRRKPTRSEEPRREGGRGEGRSPRVRAVPL